MTEVKARLSLSVPGAQLLSPQECGKNPKDSFNTDSTTVAVMSKKGKLHKETLIIKTRRQRLVKQSISISKEAFNHWIDPEAAPTEKLNREITIYKTVKKGEKTKKIPVRTTLWKNYSVKQRINWHIANIAADLHAVDYSLEVFDD